MAGRMGGKRVTVKNLTVVKVDEENDLLTLSGPIPGSPNSFVIITKTAEGKRSDLEKSTEVAVEKGADVPKEDESKESREKPEQVKEEKKE